MTLFWFLTDSMKACLLQLTCTAPHLPGTSNSTAACSPARPCTAAPLRVAGCPRAYLLC